MSLAGVHRGAFLGTGWQMVVLTFDFARHRPSASFRDCLPRRPPLLREPIPRMLLPRFVAYRRVAPTLARRDRGRRLAPLESHVGLVYDGRAGEVGWLERRTSARGFTVGLMTRGGWVGLYISCFLRASISMLQCSPPPILFMLYHYRCIPP